jgi:hypothetical protein
MTDAQWLYVLIFKPTGEYIYLDSNNDVAYTTTPTGLVFTPDGWQKKAIGWERDTKKWGLTRTFTNSLRFVRDGATLLRKISLNTSFETEIDLLIQRLTLTIPPPAHQFDYIDFYRGEIDLSDIEGGEISVTVPIAEGGILKKLLADWDTVFEIPFTDYKTIKMDGVFLADAGKFILPDQVEIKKSVFGTSFFFPLGNINNQSSAAGFGFFPQQLDSTDALSWQQIQGNINYMARASSLNTGTVNLNVTGTIKFKCNRNDPALGFRGRFITSTQDITVQNAYQVFSVTPVAGQSYSFPVSMTIPMKPDEKLFFQGIYFGGSTGAVEISIEFEPDSALSLDYKNKYRTTATKGMEPLVLFQKLVEKITGNPADASSSLLTSFANLLITCGDAVRGIDGAKIKTSLSQFFEFCRCQFVAGIGVENDLIVIEELSHFLGVSSPVDLGNSKDLKWKFTKDLNFNTIKIGYVAKDTDDVNGKYAFNNSHLYTVPVKKVVRELTVICPYPSDPYYIELNRINLDGKTTTDDSADNDVMILNTEDIPDKVYDLVFEVFLAGNFINVVGGAVDIDLFQPGAQFTVSGSVSNNQTFTVIASVVAGADLLVEVVEVVVNETAPGCNVAYKTTILKRVVYSTITGVPDPDFIFNIEYLTPKRMLLRWIKYISSCLFQFAGESITFQSTEKNRELYTDDGTTIVDEDLDEVIGMTRYFIGMYLTFENEVPTTTPATLQANPNTGYKTTWLGNAYTGILMRAAMAPNENSAQSFRTLLGPNENYKLLIY